MVIPEDNMDSFGWTFSRPQFFSRFETQSSSRGEASNNLISIKGEYCYIWRSETKTIVRALCSDIWHDDQREIPPYHEYSLSCNLSFEPEILTARRSSASTELLLLWGSSGVAVITLPSSSSVPSSQQYSVQVQAAPVQLIAHCDLVAEKVYLEHLKLRALQVKWHPFFGINMIVVLNNDNFLRFYSMSDPVSPVTVICVGPPSSAPFQYSNHSVGLVETPIDFDFGPQLPTTDYYVVFILKNSGELSYVLVKYLETTKRCHWHEQKEIYVDNDEIEEGFQDAISILVSKTFPVVITIGCISGKLHHTILLPTFPSSDTATKVELNMEENLLNGEVSLFIKEVLEIEPTNDEDGLTFMNLLPDPLCKNRYACIHGEGLHIVNMNFVISASNFFGNKISSKPVNAQVGKNVLVDSDVRYVLRCRLFQSNEKGQHAYYRSNFAFSDAVPQKFVLLLGNKQALVYEIPHLLNLDLPSLKTSTKGNAEEGLTITQQLNTLESVTSILAKTINQPYLLTQSEAPDIHLTDVEESGVAKSTRVLQREYISKQEQAINHLADILKTISLDTREVGNHLANVTSTDITEINAIVQKVASYCRTLSLKQEELHQRVELQLGSRHQILPIITDQEKTWSTTLEKIEGEMESMKALVDGLKIKISNPPNQNEETLNAIVNFVKFSETQANDIKVSIHYHQQSLISLKQSVQEIDRKNLNN